MGLGLGSTLVIARGLGPSGRGDSAAAMSALFLLPIVIGLGLPMVARRISSLGRSQEVIRTVRRSLFGLLVLSVVFGFVLVMGPLHGLDPNARVAAFVGFCLAPLTVLWMSEEGVLIAQNRYFEVAIVQFVVPGTFFLGLLVAELTNSLSVDAVITAAISANLLALITSTSLTRIPLMGGSIGLRRCFRESVTYAGAQTAEASTNKLDQIVLLPVIGSTELGYYSIAATVSMVPLAVAYAITAKLFRRVAVTSGEERRDLQLRAVRSALYWAIVAASVCAALAVPLIPLVFGSDFENAIVPTLICSVGTIGLLTAQVASNVLAASKRGKFVTFAQITGLGVNVLGIFAVAAHLGATGAAIASALAYSTIMVILLAGLNVSPTDLSPSIGRIKIAFRELMAG